MQANPHGSMRPLMDLPDQHKHARAKRGWMLQSLHLRLREEGHMHQIFCGLPDREKDEPPCVSNHMCGTDEECKGHTATHRASADSQETMTLRLHTTRQEGNHTRHFWHVFGPHQRAQLQCHLIPTSIVRHCDLDTLVSANGHTCMQTDKAWCILWKKTSWQSCP